MNAVTGRTAKQEDGATITPCMHTCMASLIHMHDARCMATRSHVVLLSLMHGSTLPCLRLAPCVPCRACVLPCEGRGCPKAG